MQRADGYSVSHEFASDRFGTYFRSLAARLAMEDVVTPPLEDEACPLAAYEGAVDGGGVDSRGFDGPA